MKLATKRCDLVVGTTSGEVGAGFAVDTNHVTSRLVGRRGCPDRHEYVVAQPILDRIVAMRRAQADTLRADAYPSEIEGKKSQGVRAIAGDAPSAFLGGRTSAHVRVGAWRRFAARANIRDITRCDSNGVRFGTRACWEAGVRSGYEYNDVGLGDASESTARTPLDNDPSARARGIERVILAGGFASDAAVGEFLREWQPALDICVRGSGLRLPIETSSWLSIRRKMLSTVALGDRELGHEAPSSCLEERLADRRDPARDRRARCTRRARDLVDRQVVDER